MLATGYIVNTTPRSVDLSDRKEQVNNICESAHIEYSEAYLLYDEQMFKELLLNEPKNNDVRLYFVHNTYINIEMFVDYYRDKKLDYTLPKAFFIFYSNVGIQCSSSARSEDNIKFLKKPFPLVEGDTRGLELLVQAAKGTLMAEPGKRFADIKINKSGEYFGTKQLATLDLILQSYLMITSPDASNGKDDRYNLASINEPNRLNQRDESWSKGIQYSPNWMFEGSENGESFLFMHIIPEVKGSSWPQLVDECEALQTKESLRELWCLLRGQLCGEEDEGIAKRLADGYLNWTLDEFRNLFVKAHQEYLSLFSCRAFEKKRNSLAHNGLSNIISQLGISRGSQTINECCEPILTLWRLNDGKQSQKAEQEAALLRSINKAQNDWPNIEKDIRELLNDDLQQWGLRLTNSGRRLRDKILGDSSSDSLVSTISSFLRDVEVIPDTITKTEALRELETFIDSVDSLQKALYAIKYKEGAANAEDLFNGYLESIP
ncbi:hypothetical protein ACFL41_00110 [Gemmatimonadota bacterium]